MDSFGIKLKDGRYFTNVIVCDEFGLEDSTETILDNQYTNDDGKVVKCLMSLFKYEDEDGNNELASMFSEDIEYICKAYESK
jgi:hypothetical protein